MDVSSNYLRLTELTLPVIEPTPDKSFVSIMRYITQWCIKSEQTAWKSAAIHICYCEQSPDDEVRTSLNLYIPLAVGEVDRSSIFHAIFQPMADILEYRRRIISVYTVHRLRTLQHYVTMLVSQHMPRKSSLHLEVIKTSFHVCWTVQAYRVPIGAFSRWFSTSSALISCRS